MPNNFQHEDALVLGMLFYTHLEQEFKDPYGFGRSGRGYNNGNRNSSLAGNLTGNPGTGRGGWYYDKNGDKGKLLKTDKDAGVVSSVGTGGNQYAGGSGLSNGAFGLGGYKTSAQVPGGGEGWFGGGSGFVRGGAGGGSSACPADNTSGLRYGGRYRVRTEPEWLRERPKGATGAYDPSDPELSRSTVCGYSKGTYWSVKNENYKLDLGYNQDDVENELEFLLSLNSRSSRYYQYNYSQFEKYYSWQEFLDMHTVADGNGFVIMSEPNKHIKFRHWFNMGYNNSKPVKSDNEFINSLLSLSWVQKIRESVSNIFDYLYKLFKIGKLTGVENYYFFDKSNADHYETITLKPNSTYEFILYGACGGDHGVWTSDDDSECGGFGGCQVVTIRNNSNSYQHLYLFCGEHGDGTVGKNAFAFGGAASQNSTGGGGATRIKFNPTDSWDTLDCTIAVAGGGGGIYCANCSGDSRKDKSSKYYLDSSLKFWNDESSIHGNIISSDQYLVNDRSIAVVEFDLVTSDDNEAPVNVDIQIDIEGGQEGTLTKQIQFKKSGHYRLEYELEEVYKTNTPTHQVTIDVSYKMMKETPQDKNEPELIVNWGSPVSIDIETRFDELENSRTFERKPIILNISDYINVDDAVNFVYREMYADETDLSDGINILDTQELLKESRREDYELIINDGINIVDGVELIKESSSGDYELDLMDSIKTKDCVKMTSKTIKPQNISIYDNVIIRDNIEIEKKTIVPLTLDISDGLRVTDNNDTRVINLYTISGIINPNEGTIIGLGIYREDEEVTLSASLNIGYTIDRWEINGSVVSKDNTCTIIITGDITVYLYLKEETPLIVIPYITQGLVSSYDDLLNVAYNYNNKSKLWRSLLLIPETYNTDDRGFVNDGLDKAFDAIENTHDEFDENAKIWHELLGEDPEITVNSLGYISPNMISSYDEQVRGTDNDKWQNLI